ncbi:MAG: glycosyltransferase family 4 protein [Bacteroidota bacterium]
MKIGFHYHSNYIKADNRIVVPGYIGVFIDSLASQVEVLYLFLEQQTDPNSKEEDYVLQQNNIELVSLGNRSTFYNRLLHPSHKVAIVKQFAQKMDFMLLRAPTPLAPYIFFALHKTTPVYTLLVGSYVKGLRGLQQPFIRKIGIILFTLYYQVLHNRMIAKSKIFVNSGELLEEYKGKAKQISLIKTTTLSEESFFERADTCTGKKINILYTGRINFQKGLRELIEAVSTLKNEYDLVINIVGWEEKGAFSYEDALKELAEKKGIGTKIIFHGKKQIGAELMKYYREADLYVIPSYHEGFPRTIWEALASSLPVIATRVGSIPYYLEHKKNAYLIEPKNVAAIAEALRAIIEDRELRQMLISNGFLVSKEVTLEKQTKKLIEIIQHEYIRN